MRQFCISLLLVLATSSISLAQDTLVRYDGLYRCVLNDSTDHYFRFFKDEKLISVSTTDDFENVKKWFQREWFEQNYYSAGYFAFYQNQLYGTSKNEPNGESEIYKGVFWENQLKITSSTKEMDPIEQKVFDFYPDEESK